MESRTPILVVNPVDDLEFGEFAKSRLQVADSAGDLQALLRTKYPAAIVRPRALSGERILVWYVYRDGRWTPSDRSRT